MSEIVNQIIAAIGQVETNGKREALRALINGLPSDLDLAVFAEEMTAPTRLCIALWNMTPDKAVPMAFLRDSSPAVRYVALGKLNEFVPKEKRAEWLLEALGFEFTSFIRLQIWARLANREGVLDDCTNRAAVILAELGNSAPRARAWAACAVGYYVMPDLYPVLQHLIGCDPDFQVRTEAVLSMLHCDPASRTPELVETITAQTSWAGQFEEIGHYVLDSWFKSGTQLQTSDWPSVS